MTRPTTYKSSVVAIYFEDPESPGVYIKPCVLTDNQYQFTKDLQEVSVPDCDDPDLPSWKERDVSSLDFSASGEGVLAAEALETWWTYFNSTDPINVRIFVGAVDDDINGYFWAGQVHMDQFGVNAQQGQRALVSINLVSHGELTLTSVASLTSS